MIWAKYFSNRNVPTNGTTWWENFLIKLIFIYRCNIRIQWLLLFSRRHMKIFRIHGDSRNIRGIESVPCALRPPVCENRYRRGSVLLPIICRTIMFICHAISRVLYDIIVYDYARYYTRRRYTLISNNGCKQQWPCM